MTPHLLFPSDIYDKRVPDPDFAQEADAAKRHGFAVRLFHLESLREGDIARAVALTAPAPMPDTPLLHRGWMLSATEYAALPDALAIKSGYHLVVAPDAYTEAHHLPRAYKHLAGMTPETVWTTGDDRAAAWQLYEAWNRPAVIVKDYIKSAKHKWREACFVPDGSARAHFDSVLVALRDYRADYFAGGYVLRRFVPLYTVGETAWGQPLHEEYRLFFWRGVCFSYAPFANPDDFAANIGTWTGIAARFASPFISMDVARTETGGFVIVEVGDGGVSGLPQNVAPDDFYCALAAVTA